MGGPTRTLRKILRDHIEAKAPEKAKAIVKKIADQLVNDKQVAYLRTCLQMVSTTCPLEKADADRLRGEIDILTARYDLAEQELAEFRKKIIDTRELKAELSAKKQAVKAAKAQLKKKRDEAFKLLESANYSIDNNQWMDAVRLMLTSEVGETSAKKGSKTVVYDILDKPLRKFGPAPSMETLRDLQTGLSRDMSDYIYAKGKEGGVNSAGQYGGQYVGIYEAADGEVDVMRALIKQDHHISVFGTDTAKHEKDIVEFITGRMMNFLIGELAASIHLMRAPWDDKGQPQALDFTRPDDSAESTYVMSIYIPGFNELYKQVYLDDGKEEPDERPRLLGLWNEFTDIFKRNTVDPNDPTGETCLFDNLNPTLVASLYLRDFDAHSGNFGSVPGAPGSKKGLVRIDFGGALRDLDDDVHMNSHWRHKWVGREPTNHIREFSRSLRINPQFADELERQGTIAREKLGALIDILFEDVGKNFGVAAIKKFAKRIGHDLGNIHGKNQILESTKAYFKNRMFARQFSLQKLALEIRLSHAAVYENGALKPSPILDDLIRQNPTYFMTGDFHFRHKNQQKKLKFTANNFTMPAWWSGIITGEAVKALHERAAEILDAEIPDFMQPDFDIKNLALRGDVMVARLQILAKFYSDKQRDELLEQAKILEEWLIRYKMDLEAGVIIGDDQTTANATNVVFLCDQAYGAITHHYQSLKSSLADATKLDQMMTLGGNFHSLEETSEQERYAKSFVRTAKKGEVDIAPHFNDYHPNSDHLYNNSMFQHHPYTPPPSPGELALMSNLVVLNNLSSTLNDLIATLAALELVLQQQRGIVPSTPPIPPII